MSYELFWTVISLKKSKDQISKDWNVAKKWIN